MQHQPVWLDGAHRGAAVVTLIGNARASMLVDRHREGRENRGVGVDRAARPLQNHGGTDGVDLFAQMQG